MSDARLDALMAVWPEYAALVEEEYQDKDRPAMARGVSQDSRNHLLPFREVMPPAIVGQETGE